MLRSFWPALPVVVLIMLAALSMGADQPVAALFFSVLVSLYAALTLSMPGAHLSPLGALWLFGGAALFLIALNKGWASAGAAEYATLISGAGVFLVARSAALRPERADRALSAIMATGAVLGLAGFVDFFLDPKTLFGFERPYHTQRLSVPFLSANTAATFYGIIGLIGLAGLLRTLKRGGQFETQIQRLALPVATLLICATCLVMSASRAGISLFMLSALLLTGWNQAADLLAHDKRPNRTIPHAKRGALWRTLAGPGALLLLAIIVLAVSGGLYTARLEQAGLFMGEDTRITLFARYYEGIWIYPILGSGLGGFEFINDTLPLADDANVLMGQNAAHNLAFQWLLQTGLTGALSAFALIGALLLRIRKGLSRRRSQRLILRTVLIIALFVFLHGMVDYALEIPAVYWLFALILGLGAGVSEGGSSRSHHNSASVPLRAAVTMILALTSGLGLYAGLDRLSAHSVTLMTDVEFMELSSQGTVLHGSPERLEAIGDRALRLRDPDLALARDAFLQSLSKERRSGKLWAKLAYTNYALIPIIAGETEDALRQSYLLMPYGDRQFMTWRLDFMAHIWAALPPDLRDAAYREARILPEWDHARWKERIATSGGNPA